LQKLYSLFYTFIQPIKNIDDREDKIARFCFLISKVTEAYSIFSISPSLFKETFAVYGKDSHTCILRVIKDIAGTTL
jgi:hypothetical protein